MLKKVDPGSRNGLKDHGYFCESNLEIGKVIKETHKSIHCSSSQPANRLTAWPYAQGSHLTPPPPHMGSRVGQPTFQSRGRSTGQRSQFTCPVYIATYHPIKPVHSEPLSVTVPVVIGTCTVLVGTVEYVPVPPHYNKK